MSTAPLTLYVVRALRAAEYVADTVASIRWSAQSRPHVIYVVTEQPNKYAQCGADLVVKSDALDWSYLIALQTAVTAQLDFSQAVCVEDDALFIGPGFDKWLSRLMYQNTPDLVAVAERQCWVDSFLLVGSNFSKWRVPHEMWERPPAVQTAYQKFMCFSRRFAVDLFYRRLLEPVALVDWPLPFSCYITWLCHLLHFNVRLIGSMDRPVAPLYINDGFGGHYNSPPYILQPDFLVYASVARVAAQDEDDVRRGCRQLR